MRLLGLSGNNNSRAACEFYHKIKTNNVAERIFSNFDENKYLYVSYFRFIIPAHRLRKTAGQVYFKEVSFVGVVPGSR